MTIIQTKDLTGYSLDLAVYQCMQQAWDEYDIALDQDLGLPQRPACDYARDYEFGPSYSPSTDPAQGHPIIWHEGISVLAPVVRRIGSEQHAFPVKYWRAMRQHADETFTHGSGDTPLIAAMRCYVASKLGEIVDIPQELLT